MRGALAVALVLALGCGSRSAAPRPAPLPAASITTTRPPERARVHQVGMASYYASRFHGRRTANGERYNEHAMTAAHRNLPFGTVVRVTRVDGAGLPVGSPVVVRINDRGPYARGRVIDLSLAAARKLQMLRAGVVRVQLEVLSSRGAGSS